MPIRNEVYKYHGYQYNRENEPHVKDDEEKLRLEGMNCRTFVHVVLDGSKKIRLPEELLSKELFEDTTYTRPVLVEEPLEDGDIFFFGKEGAEHDLNSLHVAVFAAGYLFHAYSLNQNKRGVAIGWPFEEFAQHERYKQFFGVKRLLPANQGVTQS